VGIGDWGFGVWGFGVGGEAQHPQTHTQNTPTKKKNY